MSLQTKTIAFLGAGNMGEALIRGLVAAKTVSPAQLIATDVRPDRLDYLASTYGIQTTPDNATAVAEAQIVLIAVKPQQVGEVLGNLKLPGENQKLFVSIAAGITTARLERELRGEPRVVRVMPNTPALVGAGAAALCGGRFATEDDLTTTEEMLKAVGIVVRVEEKLMDVVTALSGSGPAYVFYVAEVMIRAAITQGLSPEVARRLTTQTIFGAGILLAQGTDEPAELRRKVTSPGGTTEAAIKVMTEMQLPEIFSAAIVAAAQRGRELSGS